MMRHPALVGRVLMMGYMMRHPALVGRVLMMRHDEAPRPSGQGVDDV